MGAEALSRGAALVVGIEQSSRACAVIQQNWQQVAAADQTFQVLRGDVLQRLTTLASQPFDRIYFDPPYASGLYQPVIEAIAQHQLLAAQGEFAVEHSAKAFAIEVPQFEICRQKRYGNTALTFYRVIGD